MKRGPGRPKGSLNKATRAVREFLAELCDDPEIQAAIKQRIKDGDTVGFFKALEMVHGKAKQSVSVDTTSEWVMVTPAGDDVAED